MTKTLEMKLKGDREVDGGKSKLYIIKSK